MADLLPVALLFFAFVLHLPGSCSICAPLEFKIDTLRNADYWWFETDSKDCYKKPTGSHFANSTKCVFLFAVCKSVEQLCPEGSGMCQTVQVNMDSYKFYSLAIAQGLHAKFKFKTGKNYFNVSYSPVVDMYDDKLKFVQSTIMFKCNHASKWNSSWADVALKNPRGPKAPSPVEVIVSNKTATLLQYTFVFNSSEGCRVGGPGPGPDGSTLGSLSVGSILLILFFPAVFLYCFIGVLINRGSGKTGREMIPHSTFWCNLPNLIMTGCGFCLAKLSCQEMTSTSESYDRM